MSLDVTTLGEEADEIRKECIKDENINEDKCKEKAKKQVEELIERVKGRREYQEMDENEKKMFGDLMAEFTKDELLMQADQLLAKKRIDDAKEKIDKKAKKKTDSDLDEAVEAPELASKKKKYEMMSILAIGGILGIVALLVLAGICADPGRCGGMNMPLEILKSQFMLAIVGGVISPVVVRFLKERYDIQIEEGQVSMIMTDAIKAVKLYQNEADKLRNKDGYIPDDYQKKLRDLAFESIRTTYTAEKYKDLVASVGSQVFEKAIEEAVARNWIERFPLEKEEVESIISQTIDALPQIVEWKNLDDDVKIAFLDGHVKRLLANVGLDGWGRVKLDEIFDAEVNKRLLAAAIADGKGLLTKLETRGPNKYVKYTNIVLTALGESLGKPAK